MSVLSRIAGRFGFVRQSWVERVFAGLFGGMETRAGIPMSALKALEVATVLACVRVIAEGLGALPACLRQRTPDGAEDVTGSDVAWLLEEPNGWQTWQEFVETLTMHAVLTGNGFAWIQRGVRGQPIALLPLLPGWVAWKQNPDWSVEYAVTWPDGRRDVVGFADMFHLRGPSWDSVAGLECVRLARESIGLSAAIEWTQAGHFGRGGTPSGALTVEGKLDKPKADELRARWQEAHGGDKAGGIAVLGQGAKFQQFDLNFASAQTLETRRLQIEEICRVFRVFPQMIGVSDKATTYASAEAFFTAHAVHTLGPWAVRWEKTLSRDLLTMRQRAAQFFRIDLRALMRADARTRSEFYAKALGAGGTPGFLSPNEVRSEEGFNRRAGLDEVPRGAAQAPSPPAAPAPVA